MSESSKRRPGGTTGPGADEVIGGDRPPPLQSSALLRKQLSIASDAPSGWWRKPEFEVEKAGEQRTVARERMGTSREIGKDFSGLTEHERMQLVTPAKANTRSGAMRKGLLAHEQVVEATGRAGSAQNREGPAVTVGPSMATTPARVGNSSETAVDESARKPIPQEAVTPTNLGKGSVGELADWMSVVVAQTQWLGE